jgi:hypothetical protein
MHEISLNIIYLLYLDNSHAHVIVFFLLIMYNISLWPEDGQGRPKHVVTAA